MALEELLFSPIRIGSMTAPNRLVMPAMHMNYTMGGEVSDQLIDFYRARAEGGVGLIIIGGCSIDEVGGGPFFIGIYDDRFIPGLTRFVNEVRVTDVKICAQLYQAGRYSFSRYTQQQPIAPSPLGSRYNPETPREMTLADIAAVQDSFVAAAKRAMAAGFDAVEILGSAGYLIAQFLSPATNMRTDEYGGPFENRARFGMEVIRKVKQAVGDKLAVLVRVAGADYVPGGHTNKEAALAAKMFVEAGADAINVTGGWHESRVPQITMSVPEGAYTYLAAGIKRAVNVPVIASNRLGDPFLAAQTLADGKADLIALGRPLIADPDLPAKVREGEFDLIRPCIACNQGCFDHVFEGMPITCMLNAQAGYEKERVVEPATELKKVVVVGGGPGGAEAARVAAERGHEVVLFERGEHMGGALWYAAAPPGRADFIRLVEYLESSLLLAGVELRLGEEATIEKIVAEKPDLVIVATGAEPLVPEFIRKATHPNVLTAEDVLGGRAVVQGDVVVIGGGSVGAETAIFIAHRDAIDPETAAFLLANDGETPERVKELLTTTQRRIVVCDLLPKIAKDMGRSTRWTIMQELYRRGVTMIKNAEVTAIDENGVTIKEESGEVTVQPCGTVVVAVGYRARNGMAKDLEKAGLLVKVIGDAVQPRKVMDAVHEGFLTTFKF